MSKNNKVIAKAPQSASALTKLKKSKSGLKSPFCAYQNRNLTQRLTLTGVFLALVILLQFFEKYLPFANTYLRFNFSLLFILPIFFFSGPGWGIFALILRFAIGPAMDPLGYDITGIMGHLILLISSSVTIFIFFLMSWLTLSLRNSKWKYWIVAILTIILSSIILTLLNGLLFSPLYWWAFNFLDHPSYLAAQTLYQNTSGLQVMHFGIKSYWGGIWAVYLSGNIIKYSLIFIVNYPLDKVVKLHF